MRSICRKNAAAEFERIYALKESPCCADSGWPDRVPAVPSRLAMLRACLAMAAPDDAKRTGGLRVCNGAAATFRDGRLRLPASVFAEYSKPRPWSTPRRGRHRSERTSFMNRAVNGMLYRIFEATAAEHPLPGMASVSTHRFYEQSGQRYALPDIQSRGRGASPGASIGLNGTGFMNRAVGACFAGYSKPWPRSIPRRWRD